MKPDDLTLKAFLESKNIGVIKETEKDVMKAHGHSDESLPYTEMLFLHLDDDKINIAFFPGLIAEYLIALDFQSINISRLIPHNKYPPIPGTAENLWKFEANDEDRGKSIITITKFPKSIMFTSME